MPVAEDFCVLLLNQLPQGALCLWIIIGTSFCLHLAIQTKYHLPSLKTLEIVTIFNLVKLLKMHADTDTQSIAQLVKSMHALGLQEQAIKVVEVGTTQIIVWKYAMNCERLGHWLSIVASYGNLSSQYNEFFQQILDMKGNRMIRIVSEMHKSLQTELMGRNNIIDCFQNVLKNLQDKGWKNFSPKLVPLIIPVLLFVGNN